ncbi:TetR/AcrR family transcriptional regulator [Mesorhizobium sp. M4B.F.Ca.ET.215.01.1.1]|nr:TetR/AcrR family transcriptional regulator [Mesorhizobium sp. M4B.F.Ca.ET.013.02.1.1]RVD41001.1 TetR/AcrR family transcriptional regulator [Mesorhizobium sp. M4B.F.Ca.ET.019.03.1.1]RWC95950.1 MAG: TetR/AcrR family transcriptional regulator [Mesorhizobium sp.]TGQ10642.1 TetR/AcrR family transcriptional regulator [Mesorhizobium sp. M4B.F.Ca.ET.215.01.1.1]TGQ36216.1 TetR/AcrR family transcriptional regulator [Mesorhizobium sp. M4B.F.Ca.ET.214.01.1.1]TGQ38146.1 TetR/AcrR family transcriptional 
MRIVSAGNMTMASEKAPQPRAPQQKRGHDRVAALMTAAAELFVERGFDAATMTEIAASAGAAIGTLYLFFPTKQAMAQAILEAHAEELSAELDALREQTEAMHAATIADQLFALLGTFMATHPAYSALLDLPGDDQWRRTLRAHRREQIAALFAQAYPPLPAEQAERLAVIVPQLMRIPLSLAGETRLRDDVLDELRLMLNRHLEAGEG